MRRDSTGIATRVTATQSGRAVDEPHHEQVGRSSNGAQRFVPLNRFPDTRISSLDRVGIQGFKNAGRKSRTSTGRKKGNKFRQIVDFRERNAILGQERF